MSRIAYVNGRYLPWRQASVHIEDRGYQFSDGVYEVCEVRGGRLIDERLHMARLERSLKEQRVAQVRSREAAMADFEKVIPADPRSLVAARLRKFLDLSKDVNYSAKLPLAQGVRFDF